MLAAVRTALRIFFLLMAIASAAMPVSAQPSISASITPSPNRFGWNNTPVTVSFACTEAKSCPDPIVVTGEGDRQLVRQSVTDEFGRTAANSTEVSIDLTPAAVSFTTPSHEAATTAGAITVAARISDTLSGVESATCNGDIALVQGNEVSCVVSLRDGVNDLVMQITDRAGNSSSTGVQVRRIGPASSIIVVPSELTLMDRQTSAPQVVDNFGRTVSGVEWSIDKPSVVSLGDDGQTLTGLWPGITTVTASWRTLTSSIKVRVLPGRTPPDWTSTWTIRPLPGYLSNAEIIQPIRLGEGSPTMLSIEREIGGSRLMLRAFDDIPRQLWIEAPAISARERIGEQLTGDDMGGGLLRVETADGRSSSIVRVGRSQIGTLWRYTPTGRLGEKFAESDATVDIVETPPDGFPVLVGIDAMTGSAKFRIPLPRSSFTTANVGCIAGASSRSDRPSQVGITPTVLGDGLINLAVATTDEVEDLLPCGKGTTRRRRTVKLMQVSPDGHITYRPVYDYAPTSADPGDLVLSPVLPDGHGGQLVAWSARLGRGSAQHMVVRVIGERLIDFQLPALGPMIIAEEDMGVTTDGRTIVGFDILTGKTLWAHVAGPRGNFRILTAVGGGGLTVATERGVEHIDRSGRRVLIGDNSR